MFKGYCAFKAQLFRVKMKTAIEDYENKSGDKLHGFVVVPFFTTIFKEEAKSLCVPSIKITLPNGRKPCNCGFKGRFNSGKIEYRNCG